MSCRSWTIELPAGTMLLTANQRLHHHARAQLTAALRHQAGWLARAQKIPRIERAWIVCVYHAPDRRRRDPANWAPTAKALVDGLVDAGVLADDDAKHVIGPDMRLQELPRPLPWRGRAGRVSVHVIELHTGDEDRVILHASNLLKGTET